MSRFHSYINTAEQLILNFKGETPLAIFLRSFFSTNKKYGSKDRKQIAALCYNYFRLGHAMANIPIKKKLLAAYFLCENEPSDLTNNLMPEWNHLMAEDLDKKIMVLEDQFTPEQIFPFKEFLSAGIDSNEFSRSFLTQPDLFLRIRPKNKQSVLKKLEKSGLSYQLNDDCIILPNAIKLEDHFSIDREIIVQDQNSQKVFDFFKSHNIDVERSSIPVWDCCAASGGKSILLFDILNQHIDLTVSDIRPSIILNLHQRFKKAGLKEYKYFIADVEKKEFEHPFLESGIIICDAPCTGSGTWARTPEELYLFDPSTIERYATRQKNISTNVIPYLKKGGLFIYITCSVFKQENEEVVNVIKEKFDIELLEMKVLKGYNKKADTMFVAILKKN
ncbi:MAG: Fmu (Sun) domain-containing protein [Bacteroidota bacterium]